VPLTRVDLPAGVEPVLGRLCSYTGARGRPYVGLIVPCGKCNRTHAYAWRWDWPTAADVVSCQVTHCPKRKRGHPVWLALDPAAMEHHAAVHAAAHDAYVAWKAAKTRKPPETDAGGTPEQGPS
jgi:hypothetical protein